MVNIFGIELPTEIGLPEIDIMGFLNGIFAFLRDIAPGAMTWLFEICGGNPIIVGIVIGFPVYLIIDIFYHVVLDKPAAAIGERMMRMGSTLVIFIIVFVVVYFMWMAG